MCGLLGFATDGKHNLSPDLVTFILTLLMQKNDLRGGDSFGIAVVRPETPAGTVPYRLYKQVGTIAQHVRSKPWMDAMQDVYEAVDKGERLVVIGHNRKATTGANTSRNAHPFQFGKHDRDKGAFVLGAHNGIVSNWQKYKEGWKITRDIEVDSEVIFRGMQQQPADKTIGQLMNNAAMALTFMEDLDSVKFFRGSNPLTLQVGQHFTFWSSEAQHLASATFGLRAGEVSFVKDSYYLLDSRTMHLSKLTSPTPQEPPFKVESKIITQLRGRSGGGDKKWDPFTDAGVTRANATGRPGSSAFNANLPPAVSTLNSASYLETCAACMECMRPWQLMYLTQDNGDNYGVCPGCYYFIIQAEAEATMSYYNSTRAGGR